MERFELPWSIYLVMNDVLSFNDESECHKMIYNYS